MRTILDVRFVYYNNVQLLDKSISSAATAFCCFFLSDFCLDVEVNFLMDIFPVREPSSVGWVQQLWEGKTCQSTLHSRGVTHLRHRSNLRPLSTPSSSNSSPYQDPARTSSSIGKELRSLTASYSQRPSHNAS